MNKPTQQPVLPENRRVMTAIGLILLAAGCFLCRDAWYGGGYRILPAQSEAFLLFGPVIALVGGVMLLIGLIQFLQGFSWGARIFSSQAGNVFHRILLVAGWVMLIVGIWPYWWLDIVTRLKGQRPGNEGEGMSGALIMLFVGLPGLGLTIFNLARTLRGHKRDT